MTQRRHVPIGTVTTAAQVFPVEAWEDFGVVTQDGSPGNLGCPTAVARRIRRHVQAGAAWESQYDLGFRARDLVAAYNRTFPATPWTATDHVAQLEQALEPHLGPIDDYVTSRRNLGNDDDWIVWCILSDYRLATGTPHWDQMGWAYLLVEEVM